MPAAYRPAGELTIGGRMHRLPALQLRLAELKTMRAEYEAKVNRAALVNYTLVLIDEVETEIAEIERSAGRAGTPRC